MIMSFILCTKSLADFFCMENTGAGDFNLWSQLEVVVMKFTECLF